MTACDRIFIAVTKNMDKNLVGILPEKDMSRLLFYETIVRIAFFKYKINGLTNTTYEGLKILVNDVIDRKFDTQLYKWMGWRLQNLWQLDVNDLYKNNLPAMQLLYRIFNFQKKRRIFHMDDAIDLLITNADLALLPESISQCWGMSKMTVLNDVKDRRQYNTMTFVEFLEFFARIANFYFKE